MSDTTQYDVMIVGAGMVGATLASALSHLPLKVALVEANMPKLDWPEEGFDLRVSAITRATQQIFETLNIWEGMRTRRVSPFREMRVWDVGGEGSIHFDSADMGETHLGHIVENRVMVAALHENLRADGKVALLCPVTLKSFLACNEAVTVVDSEDRHYECKLLVAADGSRSWVRQQAGISVRGWDYDQHALVTWVKTEQGHRQTAWQRFLPGGPLAFLPLTDGYCSIVWSNAPQQVESLLAMDEKQFACELRAAFDNTLGNILEVGPRAAFPLRFFDADSYIGDRLALVGDAAHTVHPLAGQGVNLGLADAATLAEVIADASQANRNIGAHGTLRRYERWRKADNRVMLATMDSLKRLFGSQLPPLKWARNVGLSLTDHAGPIKNVLMQQAMGLSGDLSKIARGISL